MASLWCSFSFFINVYRHLSGFAPFFSKCKLQRCLIEPFWRGHVFGVLSRLLFFFLSLCSWWNPVLWLSYRLPCGRVFSLPAFSNCWCFDFPEWTNYCGGVCLPVFFYFRKYINFFLIVLLHKKINFKKLKKKYFNKFIPC